ncbi:hypothetical protein K7432_011578 [Basidiobolus ranarum]|uniref:RING-type domain-containing protein n=1 Tax=Basidiobolus ranarum TaxID=34480 RepID=A0ABR2VTM6_9FUNG
MVTTPEARNCPYNSLEVIDLTDLPDHHQTTTYPQQVICISESGPLSTHESNTRALIVLSDEEAEPNNVRDGVESNRINTDSNVISIVAPFRSYGNAPVFDYNFIRDPFVEQGSTERSVYLHGSEPEMDPIEETPRTRTSILAQDMLNLSKQQENVQIDPLPGIKPLDNENNNMDIKCSICLDNPLKLTTTFCGHLFCDECIHRSIKIPSKACPVCREPLTQKKMRILQLRVLPIHEDGFSRTKRSTSVEVGNTKKVKLAIPG